MTQTHDFGGGPVPAHRHENGGGWVAESATVDPTAYVAESAEVGDRAQIGGWAVVGHRSLIGDGARVEAQAHIGNDASIRAKAQVGDMARIGNGADIRRSDDVLYIAPVGSRNDSLTIYRHRDGGVRIHHGAGCEHESIEAFEAAVRAKHGDNRYAQEYLAVIALVRARFGLPIRPKGKP